MLDAHSGTGRLPRTVEGSFEVDVSCSPYLVRYYFVDHAERSEINVGPERAGLVPPSGEDQSASDSTCVFPIIDAVQPEFRYFY